MKKKGNYRTADVETLDVESLVAAMKDRCVIAVDVAKTKMVAAIASEDAPPQLVRFEHPRQTGAFLRLVQAVRDAKLETVVAMESTGTYGDSLRFQCHALGVPIVMIAPKHTHDFAEVHDGVPSMHDAKAALVMVELVRMGKGKRWSPDSRQEREMRAVVEQRGPLTNAWKNYYGHLEAMLARHWPEFGTDFDVQSQTAQMLLEAFPGPEAVVAAGRDAVAAVVRKASRGRHGAERVAALIDSARRTYGEPMLPMEQQRLQSIVAHIRTIEAELADVDARLAKLVESNAELRAMAVVAGPALAAAIGSTIGVPSAFGNAKAFEKAMGLNLKERSSGENKSELHITKRGPSAVRQMLFLAALRLIKGDELTAKWYRARKSYRPEGRGNLKSIVAVMRKLAQALFHVARGGPFDSSKLFDERRLTEPAKRTPKRAA